MKPIKCLIFDDSQTEITEIERTLNLYWQEIQKVERHVPNLECIATTDSLVLRASLDISPCGFDLFLCDILVPDASGKTSLAGVTFIREAILKSKIPVVVAISSGPDDEHRGNFIMAIQNTGCDLIVEKSQFFHHNGDAITRDIVRILEKKNRLIYRGQLMKESFQEKAPELLAIFGKIGEDTLSAISSYFCVNETAEKVFLSVLRPGLSGADVLRARYTSTTAKLENRGVLLKVSRDVDKLADEYKKYQIEVLNKQILDSNLIVHFVNKDQPYNVAGWGALGIKFEHESSTFLSWLTDNKTEIGAVLKVLNLLFLDYGLTSTYTNNKTVEDIDGISAIQKALLTPYRIASIGAAIRELAPLINRHGNDGEGNLQSLENMLSDNALPAVNKDKISKRTIFCTQHGDLHARNVLVASNGSQHRPKIIDYANIGSLPWSADIARFLVDIAIDGIDRGEAGYEWANLKSWSYLIELLIDGKISLQDDKYHAAHKAIEWIRNNLFAIYAVDKTNQHMAEYCLTLAIELMRASYRKEELPAPKRAFALIAAVAALKRAEQEFLQVTT